MAMTTGEFTSSMALLPMAARLDRGISDALQQLRHGANLMIGNLLEVHQGKEAVVSIGAIDDTAPSVDGRMVYRITFTLLLLNWQSAEVGDCVHDASVPYEVVGGKYARFPQGDVFEWEGKWWKRIK